jgi:hypothetical protein
MRWSRKYQWPIGIVTAAVWFFGVWLYWHDGLWLAVFFAALWLLITYLQVRFPAKPTSVSVGWRRLLRWHDGQRN